jgi:uncharacterized SAM-binding protein YcdF (DUF218 family)
VLVVLAVAIPLATAARIWWAARHSDHPRSDAIIVLGASQFDGRPSAIFQARLRHARDLYRRGVAAHIVTVGGNQPGDRFTEGHAGRRWLVRHDVPAEAVVKVEKGSDTLSSLRAVRNVFTERGWRTAVIVTDPWHSLRSRTMAHDLGIEAHTSPTRGGPVVRTRDTELRYIGRETLSHLHYKVFRRSSDAAIKAV